VAAAALSPVSPALSPAALPPLGNEAVGGEQAAGVDTAAQAGLDVGIADLGGTPFGRGPSADGVMAGMLPSGTGRGPGSAVDRRDPAVLDRIFAAEWPGFTALTIDGSVVESLVSGVEPRRGGKKA
jgi:hypothetical protein